MKTKEENEKQESKQNKTHTHWSLRLDTAFLYHQVIEQKDVLTSAFKSTLNQKGRLNFNLTGFALKH